MAYGFPRYNLTVDQNKWLTEVYQKFQNSKLVVPFRLRRRLIKNGAIANNFDETTISDRLIQDGNRITLAGVLELFPESDLAPKMETLLNHIKGLVDADPDIDEIQVSTVATATTLTATEISNLLHLIGAMGRWYTGLSGNIVGNQDLITVSSFSVGDERVMKKYDRFVNIGTSITKFLNKEAD